MALTPRRNPVPNLRQNTGLTGTTSNPASITTRDGLVTDVTEGASAGSTSVGGGSSGGGRGASPSITAIAPLSYVDGTLTVADATTTSEGVVQLDGDLGGTGTSPLVTGLQGFPLSNTAPLTGQAPVWNGTEYVPATAGGGSSGTFPTPARVYPIVRPTFGQFAWFNQGTATDGVDPDDGSIWLAVQAEGEVLRGIDKPLPAIPYTVIGAVHPSAVNAENFQSFGLYWRDSVSGNIEPVFMRGDGVWEARWEEWSNATTPVNLVGSYSRHYQPTEIFWFKLVDDGTSRSIFYSADGKNWTPGPTKARTTWSTPDHAGFFLNSENNVEATANLVSWNDSGITPTPSALGNPGLFAQSLISPPAVAGFTYANQRGSTTSQNGGNILLTVPPSTTLNITLLYMAQPTPPYAVIAFMKCDLINTNTQVAMLHFYDSVTGTFTSTETAVNNGGAQRRVSRWNSVTSYNGARYLGTETFASGLQFGEWSRIRNDGTTLYYDYSLDGTNWINLSSEAIGAFITPNSVGFGAGCDSNGSIPLYLSVMSYTTTGSAAF